MKVKVKKPTGKLSELVRYRGGDSSWFGLTLPLIYPANHPRAIYKAAKKAAKMARRESNTKQ